jgi:pimeloyl-ACP methyl ester carboxylesterase
MLADLVYVGEFMNRIILQLTVLGLLLTPSRPASSEEPGGIKHCWRQFWSKARQIESNLKSSCRRCTQNWYREKPQPVYGLRTLPLRANVPSEQLVVFVHGLNSRPEDLGGLVAEVEQAGHWCATFRYPNDQPITASASLLSSELRELRKRDPLRQIVLIAHSMGGLVVREAVENGKLDPGNVERLILIAPPNHGSRLAEIAISLDILEYISCETRRDESGFVYGSILDGLAEANGDLKPGSRFLRTLNARPRNPSVKYTIVLGTGGPLRTERMEECVSLCSERCSWLRGLDIKLNHKLSAVDELVAGQGDGLVSVRRGRLEGVDDVILGRFDHAELLRRAPEGEALDARRQILARITSVDQRSSQHP